MVAEERMVNVFICVLQFGKLLKLYFILVFDCLGQS